MVFSIAILYPKATGKPTRGVTYAAIPSQEAVVSR
jgi:hypothetical protein